jgi:hypothetical protein
VGGPNAKCLFFGGEASTGVAIEAPPVQCADQFVAVDGAKDGKVGIAMWARALQDPIANLNLFVRDSASIWVGLAECFRLGSSHSFLRE